MPIAPAIAAPDSSKLFFVSWVSVAIEPMQTATMSASMTAYSTAVVPSSSRHIDGRLGRSSWLVMGAYIFLVVFAGKKARRVKHRSKFRVSNRGTSHFVHPPAAVDGGGGRIARVVSLVPPKAVARGSLCLAGAVSTLVGGGNEMRGGNGVVDWERGGPQGPDWGDAPQDVAVWFCKTG